MTRAPAKSTGEIFDRHRCVACVANGAALPDVPSYAPIVITQESGVISALTAAIAVVRSGFEVSEVYVRPVGEDSFDPLGARHLAMEGAWAIVARRRHPSNEPRVVGIMLAKDEADVIPEVIEGLKKTLDTLYFRASDQETKAAILASSMNPSWARAAPEPADGYKDGYRQVLLECARADAETDNDPRPLWIMVVQGDEIYADDLRAHIMFAQAERATVMTCQVATFLLHESQKEGWDWTLPLEKRLTHYIWDFGEHTGFLNFPWIYYDPAEHMRAHPHGLFPAVWAKARPVRKHYPFRTPEQARARIEDRIKSGWQPHYENYRNVFMGDEAAGRPLKRYFGWFGEAERVEGIW